ncbi:MAG: hypothetical protein JJE17_07810 [Peptostreptococcaceae bacterium]|nr:hypothetical protein [Peptostreptococcaceae bacterium]
MRDEFIEKLNLHFGEINFNQTLKDWCLISINPLPPEDEIQKVISDIQDNLKYNIENGHIRHLETCNKKSHPIDRKINSCISLLKEDNFKIAICMKEEASSLNQPLAISLDPLISLIEYPDHMHVNAPLFPSSLGTIGLHLPESICYNKEQNLLGIESEDRILAAMGMIVMWAFKQQIWLATREKYGMGNGIWIGTHTPYFEKPGTYFLLLNPFDKCRCGSNKLYKDCCLLEDAKAYRNERPNDKDKHDWEKDFAKPRWDTIKRLRKIFSLA